MHRLLRNLRKFRYPTMLFALMIVVSQFSSMLHSHELEEYGSEIQCELCIVAKSLDNLATSDNTLQSTVFFLSSCVDTITQPVYNLTTNKPYHSQAPPIYS
jgi:hypothetical protein